MKRLRLTYERLVDVEGLTYERLMNVKGLTYERLVDVGNDTTAGDGRLDERVQLLVSPKPNGFFTGPDPQQQSRQSAKLSLHPHPFTRRRVCTPPPPGGGAYSRSQFGRGDKHCGTLGIYVCRYFQGFVLMSLLNPD